MFCCIGNAKSKASKPPASSAAKGSSPEIKLGSYFSSSIDGKENISHHLLFECVLCSSVLTL